TRPEGLGGSRDAGPAAAGPRPPYVTEAVRGGYGYGYGYGCTGRTGQQVKQGVPSSKIQSVSVGAFRGLLSTMLRYSFALRSRLQRQQRQQTQKDHLITGCQEGGRTRGPRQQTSRPSSSSSFLRQGSQRPNPRSFFSTFAADTATAMATATATATANALVATVPLLLLLSLSNALFDPIFSAAFFVLWFSVLFFPPFSSYGRPYDLQRRQEQGQDQESFVVLFVVFFLRPYPPLRPFQGRGIQQFLDQFEEQVLDRRVDWLPFFVAPPCLRQIQVLTEDLPWPAAKTALLRYYGAFDQIRTVGFYEKLRRHEARRPKTKDTIDWLEKHAFLCTRPEGLGGSRDAGPAAAGPRPPYVTEAEAATATATATAVRAVRAVRGKERRKVLCCVTRGDRAFPPAFRLKV
ncbi:hypothetical protein L249_1039, partial [Ophiocordyceps polyrhachis-furcata BCC 54312]